VKVLLLNCFLMLAFLSLIGCSQNQKSVDLQVSASFTVGAAGFTGGLIAYGEGPNGAKFAVSSGTGQSVNTTIVDGTWKIYVMGWEGNATGNKFVGLTHCGMSEVNLAFNDTSVNITLADTNCSGSTFATDVLPKNLLIASCGAFYKYNAATDSFTTPDSDSFCSTLPTNLKTSFEYYRLALPTIQGSNVSPGIESACINAKHDSTERLNVPTQKFPFRVMMYRSLQDCMNPTNPRLSAFGFLNGFQSGNQPSFDHHYASSSGNARLFLPSSMTRRGFSPFMGMIPRILCGTGDCFAQPILPTFTASATTVTTQFKVPWSSMSMDNNNDKTIIQGFRPTNVSSNDCDSPTKSLLNQNPNFSVEKCSIQNGDLRGNFVKNGLVCRNNYQFNDVSDLYERNGRIYYYDSNSKKIHVYSDKGVQLNTVDLSLGIVQNYKSMATDSANNLYVVITDTSAGTNYRKLFKYNFSNGNYLQTASANWHSGTYSYLLNIEKIEVTDNGKIVAATTNSIQAFDLINNTPGNIVTVSVATIKKILFRNSKLYILTFESSYPELYAATISGLTLSSLGTSYFTGSSDPEYASFHYTEIAGSKYFVFNPKGATDDLKIFPVSTTLTTPSVTIAYNAQGAGDIASGGPIIMVKNMIYKKSGSTTFTARNFIPGTSANVVGSAIGECTAQLTQAATPNSPAYALNLRSSNAASLDILFDEAFRYIGRRDVASDNTFYYFQSLAESNKDNGPNAGGVLGHAEQMLGPDGVGGVLNGLYPGKTCAEIVTLLPATGSVIKTANLFDIIDGTTQAVSMILSKNGMDDMGDFVGYPSNSSTKYDLAVTASFVGISDKMKIQLKCGQKLGSLESMGYEVSKKESHNRLLWNTISSNSYYEDYGLEVYNDNGQWKTRASLTRLVKTVASGISSLDTRRLEMNRNNTINDIEGSVVEVFRNSNSNLMTRKVSTGYILQSQWNSQNTNIGADTLESILTTDSIKEIEITPGTFSYSAPALCMSTTNTSLITANNLTCTIPSWISSAASSPSLDDYPSLVNVKSLEELHDETSQSVSTSSMSSNFRDVFELYP
jgi:hypothetical protein